MMRFRRYPRTSPRVFPTDGGHEHLARRITQERGSSAEAELFISSTGSVGHQSTLLMARRSLSYLHGQAPARCGFRRQRGRNSVRMTFFNGPMTGHPGWSPDGQWITFHARLEGTLDLFVIPAAGGPPKRLTTNTWEDHYPNYSVMAGRCSFEQRWARCRSGGCRAREARRHRSPPQVEHMPIESPDGKSVSSITCPRIPAKSGAFHEGSDQVQLPGPTHRFPVGYP